MQRRPAARIPTAAQVAFLRDPRHYRDGTRAVRVIETHFAWVFLTRRHAWKLKKPLRQWPLDYRSLASRQHGCEAELQLNRRLAPRVYQAVVALTVRADGRLELDGTGRTVDWLVRMRRLPAARMLDQRLLRGQIRAADLDRITRLLADFHAGAERRPLAGEAYLRRLRQRTADNRRALRARGLRFDPALVDAIAAAQLAFIAAAGDRLRPRAARLVDGHGDLRPEHVYPGPPACVIDCLEFSAGLRVLDPAEELAFLAAECERMGAPAVGWRLLQLYCAASGDAVPTALLHFYMSQRAMTRARISAWRLRDPRLADPVAWRDRTSSYLAQARRHADEALALASGSHGRSVRRRPAQQQRGQGSMLAHAPQRRAEQRRD
jgi:aminoglycoside phosphotransferase family enzyme